MKPIDADLLCEAIFPWGDKDPVDLFKIIQDAPEIRALMFGRWIDVSDDNESGEYMCSCCGTTFVEENRLDNYCRECGAMMIPADKFDSCSYSMYYCHKKLKNCNNCVVLRNRMERGPDNIMNESFTDNMLYRCLDCAYLIEGDNGAWVCDNCGKNICEISNSDCPNCDDNTGTRNLTDEESEIYDSWLNSQATKTGVNLLDDETHHYDRLLDDETGVEVYMTNADKIRQMTDEELANVLQGQCACCAYQLTGCTEKECKKGAYEWLTQEDEQ